MREKQITALQKLLSIVLPPEKLSPAEIDALVRYIAEVTQTEDEVIHRLSTILQNNPHGMSTSNTTVQVELLRDKITNQQDRIRTLEQENSRHQKLPIIQAIFIALTFIAATVSLLKAFGLIQLPWLH